MKRKIWFFFKIRKQRNNFDFARKCLIIAIGCNHVDEAMKIDEILLKGNIKFISSKEYFKHVDAF